MAEDHGGLPATLSRKPRGAATSYRAKDLAGGERIPVKREDLCVGVNERGLLAGVDERCETLKMRRVIEGSRGEVLHLKASELSGNSG